MIKPVLKLLRPMQWVKNGFVFAALFFASRLFDGHALQTALETFVMFCLVSSAVYIFNDIRDYEADRQHVKKRFRPIASGAISLRAAWALLLVLLGTFAGLFIYTDARLELGLVFLIYLAINIFYSMGFKQYPLVELFMVASGFVLRLIAGAVAIDVPISSWIMVCTGLVSLLLVTGKRRGDLAQDNDPQNRRKVLESYTVPFLDSMITVLASSTLVTYLLFCTSEYGQTRFGAFVELTAVFVGLGIFRFMQLVMVRGDGDSPTTLVVKDRVMLATLFCWAAIFFGLIYGEHL